MVVLVAILAVVCIVAVRALARRAALLVVGVPPGLPAILAGSRPGTRLLALHARLAERHPGPMAFLARRFDPRRPTGLPLTLTVLAALYLVGLFSGLTEEILEAQGTIYGDNAVNAALGPWRVEPFVSFFKLVTDLGGTPAIVAAVLIATGFLWRKRNGHVMLGLWVTCIGAVSTTAVGKLLIARHRPEIVLDVNAPGWSFPSGHSTASMAVYGFIAYVIVRSLPGFRERFEVAFWTAVLIFLIGFSRIFLGVHYVTDVMGGFMVGAFWLLIGFGMTECLSPHRGGEAGPPR